MVYAVLLIELLALLPLASVLRKSPRYVPWVWFAIGFLLFMYPGFGPLGLSVISWPVYPGHTRGIEITIIDILACTVLFAQGRDAAWPKPPFRPAMAAYFLAAVFSIFMASLTMAAVFYCWQLLRMFLLFSAVYGACRQQQNLDSLLRGLALGMAVELALVLYQKYLAGNPLPSGTFIHRNALGLSVNPTFLPMLALLLASPASRLIGLGTLSGMATAALLASRASAGLAGAGTVAVYFLSMARQSSKRKIRIGLVGMALALAMVPVALSTLNDRKIAQGGTFGEEDYDERAAFIEAASLMLNDHPLGVGANHFVLVANAGGYFDNAGVAATLASRSAHVHNIYWLTLAELGYFGFAALVWLLAWPLITAYRQARRHRNVAESDMLMGLGVALLVLYCHSYFEWMLVTAVTQHFMVVTWGIIAGLTARLETARAAETKAPAKAVRSKTLDYAR